MIVALDPIALQRVLEGLQESMVKYDGLFRLSLSNTLKSKQ